MIEVKMKCKDLQARAKVPRLPRNPEPKEWLASNLSQQKIADYKPFNGYDYTKALEDQIIADLGQSYVQGLTLLGGEPFLNTQVCLQLVKRVRAEYGHQKDIWSWSGYTWEELQKESADKLELLSYLDVLVDGRFLEAQKDLTLQFRGSANQRIIAVPASLKARQPILWQAEF